MRVNQLAFSTDEKFLCGCGEVMRSMISTCVFKACTHVPFVSMQSGLLAVCMGHFDGRGNIWSEDVLASVSLAVGGAQES